MTMQEAREKAGLSKEVMARTLGVSTRTIYNWEHGRTPVTSMAVYAYAGVTGVRAEDITSPTRGALAARRAGCLYVPGPGQFSLFDDPPQFIDLRDPPHARIPTAA